MTRIEIYCNQGHERFVVAEWCWFDEQADPDRRVGYWRQHGFGTDPAAAEGTRKKQMWRVVTPGVNGRSEFPPEGYDGPWQGQYRFHCARCGFNEVRNDGGVRYGDDDGDSEVTAKLLDVFGMLYDNGVGEIEVRNLIRLAWA